METTPQWRLLVREDLQQQMGMQSIELNPGENILGTRSVFVFPNTILLMDYGHGTKVGGNWIMGQDIDLFNGDIVEFNGLVFMLVAEVSVSIDISDEEIIDLTCEDDTNSVIDLTADEDDVKN